MAELFQRDRSVIGKHVRNVFKEGELVKDSVWAKFAYTATDGKTYNVVRILFVFQNRTKQTVLCRTWPYRSRSYLRKSQCRETFYGTHFIFR